MKRIGKCLLLTLVAVIFVFALVLSGCTTQAYVTSIAKTGTNGAEDIYTITYSDGSTDTFTVTNGTNGADGQNADISAIYEAYKEQTNDPDLTFEEFLGKYLTLNTDMSSAINRSLQSTAKIYAEFVETTTTGGGIGGIGGIFGPSYSTSDIAVSTGARSHLQHGRSGRRIHLFCDRLPRRLQQQRRQLQKRRQQDRAQRIRISVRGAKVPPPPSMKTATGRRIRTPTATPFTTTATTPFRSNTWAARSLMTLPCSAQRRATSKRSTKMRRPSRLRTNITWAKRRSAIGNPEGYGLSVTQGIISTESEYITLKIDRYGSLLPLHPHRYRTLQRQFGRRTVQQERRTHRHHECGQRRRPEHLLCRSARNRARHGWTGSFTAPTTAMTRRTAPTPVVGVTASTRNSKYVYDAASGYGNISEEVILASVNSGSVAETLGLAEGDRDRLRYYQRNGAYDRPLL